MIGYIQIKKGQKKCCKGYYDLIKRRSIPCRLYEDLTKSEYSQCKNCEINSGFKLCLGCNGSMCKARNNIAKQFCNQEHYVYLAYFANDKFKVGTTASYRKYERLLEQGAIYSIFLAKTSNGKIARKIETEISKLGISSKVNMSYKINNIIIDKESEEIEKALINEYKRILIKLDKSITPYIIDPQYNDFGKVNSVLKRLLSENIEQMSIFSDIKENSYISYNKITSPEEIEGKIIATIGNLILIEKNQEYSLINMKYLEGWEVYFKIKGCDICNKLGLKSF